LLILKIYLSPKLYWFLGRYKESFYAPPKCVRLFFCIIPCTINDIYCVSWLAPGKFPFCISTKYCSGNEQTSNNIDFQYIFHLIILFDTDQPYRCLYHIHWIWAAYYVVVIGYLVCSWHKIENWIQTYSNLHQLKDR
jgi:hypothetical protein